MEVTCEVLGLVRTSSQVVYAKDPNKVAYWHELREIVWSLLALDNDHCTMKRGSRHVYLSCIL